MQLGGKAFIRCENKPAVIITEKEATTCGQHGSMSLCEDCFDAFKERDGRDVDIAPIAPLFGEETQEDDGQLAIDSVFERLGLPGYTDD